jgi:putative histone chaperone complex ubinuclein-like protein
VLPYREREKVRARTIGPWLITDDDDDDVFPPPLLRSLFSTLEGSGSQVSEQGLRKALYQKILAAFPEGWMSSGQISREGEQLIVGANYDVMTRVVLLLNLVSVMKKKFEKEAMEE